MVAAKIANSNLCNCGDGTDPLGGACQPLPVVAGLEDLAGDLVVLVGLEHPVAQQ